MAEGDYIQFGNDPQGRSVVLRQPWSHEGASWPPPAELGLLVGKDSGRIHRLVTDPAGEREARDHVAAQGVVFDDKFEVRWFTQVSASAISDEDIATMTHVARGAAYAPRRT